MYLNFESTYLHNLQIYFLFCNHKQLLWNVWSLESISQHVMKYVNQTVILPKKYHAWYWHDLGAGKSMFIDARTISIYDHDTRPWAFGWFTVTVILHVILCHLFDVKETWHHALSLQHFLRPPPLHVTRGDGVLWVSRCPPSQLSTIRVPSRHQGGLYKQNPWNYTWDWDPASI